MSEAIRWLVAMEVIGLLVLPLTVSLLRPLPDRGIIFSKVLGLLLVTYLTWLVGSTLPLAGGPWLALLSGVVLGAASWFLAGRAAVAALRAAWRPALAAELLFLAAFTLWSVLRVYVFHAAIDHTEQFMDMAFLNASYHSVSYPPYDPWMSGHSINYYYFGYLTCATLAKLAGVIPPVAYNLALSALFALLVGTLYSLGYALTRRLSWALLAPVAVALLGNWYGLTQVLGGQLPGNTHWWFWNSTRVVAGQGDYTINEFPFFSFILGDLHPHVMALPYDVLALALATAILLWPGRRSRAETAGVGLSAALTLGALFVTNSWDLPTYFLLLAGALLAHAYLTDEGREWWQEPLLLSLAVGLAALLLYLPFYLHFHAPVHGLGLVTTRSSLDQFVVVFGFQLLLAAFLVGSLAYLLQPAEVEIPALRAEHGQVETGFALQRGWLVAVIILIAAVLGLVFSAWTLLLLVALGLAATFTLERVLQAEQPNRADSLALMLIILSCLVLAGTEIVYLRDSFAGSASYRMNTVFKFYYQAWLLLGIAGAYGLYRTWAIWQRLASQTAASLFLLVGGLALAAGAVYTVLAPGPLLPSYGSLSLNGMAWLDSAYPSDAAGIQWLIRHAPARSVVAEATGNEYTDYARVSTFTGLPTIMGWAGHEGQWRGADPAIGTRVQAIRTLYTTTSIPAARSILATYHVRYIFVGDLERQAYGTAGLAKFRRFTRPVFQRGTTVVYAFSG